MKVRSIGYVVAFLTSRHLLAVPYTHRCRGPTTQSTSAMGARHGNPRSALGNPATGCGTHHGAGAGVTHCGHWNLAQGLLRVWSHSGHRAVPRHVLAAASQLAAVLLHELIREGNR